MTDVVTPTQGPRRREASRRQPLDLLSQPGRATPRRRRPLGARAALAYVDGWLAHPTVTTPEPTNRHTAVLADLRERTGVGDSRVSDAHLAALAIEHGATLYSCDNDFARFPGLEWTDPLA